MKQIRYLEWDSIFFNLKIGKIDVVTNEDQNTLLDTLLTNQTLYDLIYVFSSYPLNSNILSLPNLKLVDTKVLLSKSLEEKNISNSNLSDIMSYQYELPNSELYKLSLISGMYSRYKLDGRLPSGSFEKLYNTWIEKSVSKEISDVVLIHKKNLKIDAMCTLKYKLTEPQIGIIAVDDNSRGTGIGSKMIMAAEQCVLNETQYRKLKVATQLRNETAMNFYKKNRFEVISTTYVYHFWC